MAQEVGGCLFILIDTANRCFDLPEGAMLCHKIQLTIRSIKKKENHEFIRGIKKIGQ